MLKSRPISSVLLALLLVVFGVGIVRLFQMRFNSGDIYPAYSSLRADPLGAKALYESLGQIRGLSVGRFFRQDSKLEGNPRSVLFVIGVDQSALEAMSESDFKAMQGFMFSGGRIVLSLFPDQSPQASSARHKKTTQPQEKSPSKKELPENDKTNDFEPVEKMVSFLAQNKLRLKRDPFFIPDTAASRAKSVESNAPPGFPASISWHSAVYFESADTNWRAIYRRATHPVILERSFGNGSLVLAADSYFLSNEALRRERHVELLSWMVGGHDDVLFDETHLGVEEKPGVAALLRRYHLEGALLALLVVAALFVWKNSAPLVPASSDDSTEGRSMVVQGRETTAGFASLLRRSIPPSQILPVCFAEWKAACAREPRVASRLAAIEEVMAAEKTAHSPPAVETYRRIQHILNDRK